MIWYSKEIAINILCSSREDLKYIYEGEIAKVHISEYYIIFISVIYNDCYTYNHYNYTL